MSTSANVIRRALGKQSFTRLPRHIGVIPDGNRRWAVAHGLGKAAGYAHGLQPAAELVDTCWTMGISEITFYGFTQDNAKRPRLQRVAFQHACVQAAEMLDSTRTDLHVVGDRQSSMFPPELLRYTRAPVRTADRVRVNLLVNYSWQWDLGEAVKSSVAPAKNKPIWPQLGSSAVSTVDVILRWGGRSRLSGFLPLQSAYSDLYVIDALWPDFHRSHLTEALKWYQTQDVTLGG